MPRYSRYSLTDALRLFNAEAAVPAGFDVGWLVRPHVVLCFAQVGKEPPACSFLTGSFFQWVTPGGTENGAGMPPEVWGHDHTPCPIHLFARARSGELFIYLGELERSYACGVQRGTPGYSFADFALKSMLPSAVWQELGGPTHDPASDTRLDAAFADAARRDNLNSRLVLIQELIRYWHGTSPDGSSVLPSPDSSEVLAPDDSIQAPDNPEIQGQARFAAVPYPLQVLYRSLKLCPAGMRAMSTQNALHSPSELHVDDDGYLVFFSENQAVCRWAVRAGDTSDDPVVWCDYTDSGTWQPEHGTLSDFLTGAILFEALWAAPYIFSAWAVDRDRSSRLLKSLGHLPISPWLWPGYPTTFHGRHGVFAIASSHGANGELELTLAARTDEAFRRLDGIREIEWNQRLTW